MIPQPQPTPGKTDWFIRDRFGMFIHWGIYAAAARHEWIKKYEKMTDERYQRYFDHFNPDLYDPKDWARRAREAGMKYFVITTKHHDGFCMWDTDQTEYKVTNTPCGKDLIAPMVEAFRNEGLKVGFYHSLIDWHHPEFVIDRIHPQWDDYDFRQKEAGRDQSKYAEYLYRCTEELATRFGKIDIMWFDFSYDPFGDSPGKGKDDWQAENLLAMLRSHQPDIIVNNRTQVPQDIHTPEQFQPRAWFEVDGNPVVWEACQTFSGAWGYHRDEMTWKPVLMLVQMLIDTVSKGGNLLLNVGPTARGYVDDRACERLAGIGEWMHLHDRSIYDCTQSEFKAPTDCRFTQNGDRLYLHIFAWPFKHLHVDGLAGKVEYAQLLNDASEVLFTEDSDTVTFSLPINQPNVAVPVIEIFLK